MSDPVIIKNWDDTSYGDKNFRQGHKKMPNTQMRCCMVGVSGSGKTNACCDLILRYLSWDRLFIFSPSVDQPKWLMMKDITEKMETDRDKKALQYIDKHNKNKAPAKRICLEDLDLKPISEYHYDMDDFNLDDLDKSDQNLVIIDDFMLRPSQTDFINLYCRGRHKNVNICYLSQDWFTIPKNVRRNTNLFLLFGNLPEANIDMIRRDAGVPKDKKEWRECYKDATKDLFSFIVIDKTKTKIDEQFSRGFNTALFPNG
jgi:hypothetical protein